MDALEIQLEAPSLAQPLRLSPLARPLRLPLQMENGHF